MPSSRSPVTAVPVKPSVAATRMSPGLATASEPRRTWASVGLFRAAMFAHIEPGTRLALRPRLDAALAAGRLGAQAWEGHWTDVGNAERLAALNGGADGT